MGWIRNQLSIWMFLEMRDFHETEKKETCSAATTYGDG